MISSLEARLVTVQLEGLICDSTARATPLAAVKLASESLFEFTIAARQVSRSEQSSYSHAQLHLSIILYGFTTTFVQQLVQLLDSCY